MGLAAAFASVAYGEGAQRPSFRSNESTASLTLAGQGLIATKGVPLALAGRRFVVVGRVGGVQPGESVLLTVTRRGEGRRQVRVPVRRAVGSGAGGRFTARLAAGAPGSLRVEALRESDGERSFLAVKVVRPALRFGVRGPLVRVVQRRLRALRFSVSPTGIYDSATGRAVLAYREVGRLGRSASTNERVVVRLLRGWGAFRPRFPSHGRHVEADLSRRVLALVDGARVARVLHTSPGRRATPTVLGSFRFYRRHEGRNRSGMLHSSYFLRGYAVHGYDFVPTYSDSHGCLRIPNADARFVFDWIRIGDRIDVYRTGPRGGGKRSRAKSPRKENR